jgi:molybdopterin converting factor subunit 1
MRVTIRLFARLREIAGESELPQDLPDEATVRTAWEATVRAFPSLAEYERSLSAAVNDDYARFTTPLTDGDDVAFLPPVSGGEKQNSEFRRQKTEDRRRKTESRRQPTASQD